MLHGTDKSPAFVQDYREYHTEATVRFVVTLTPANMAAAEKEGLYKKFKLESRISTTNMVLFDEGGCLRKYESVRSILKDFFQLRSKRYDIRKEYLEGQLKAEAAKLTAQARYITEKISGKLVLEDKPLKEIIAFLQKTKYPSDPVKEWKLERKKIEQGEDAVLADEEAAGGESSSDEEEGSSSSSSSKSTSGPDYDYLLDMKMRSMSREKKEELLRQRDHRNQELVILQNKTGHDLWKEDLSAFEVELAKREAQEKEDAMAGKVVLAQAKKAKAKSGGRSAKAMAQAQSSLSNAGTEPVGEYIPPDVPAFSEEAPAARASKKRKAEDAPGNDAAGDGSDAEAKVWWIGCVWACRAWCMKVWEMSRWDWLWIRTPS